MYAPVRHTHTECMRVCPPLTLLPACAPPRETENYIKSDNAETTSYDSLLAAVTDTKQNGAWPYRRLLAAPPALDYPDYALTLYPMRNDPLPNLALPNEPEVADWSYYESAVPDKISTHPLNAL